MLCPLSDTLGTHLSCEESRLACLGPRRAGGHAPYCTRTRSLGRSPEQPADLPGTSSLTRFYLTWTVFRATRCLGPPFKGTLF